MLELQDEANAAAGPKIQAVHTDGLSSSGWVGVSVGLAALMLLVGTASWICYRRRGNHKKLQERPVTLRRPTAVKNPTPTSHYLKKSPSPTGAKTPPGKSPTGGKSPSGGRSPSGAPPSGSGGLSPNSCTPGGLSPAHQVKECPVQPQGKEYLGDDYGSELVPLVANTGVKLKRTKKKISATMKIWRTKQKEKEIRAHYNVTGRTCPESNDSVTFENEQDKPSTPSKEELELNERNLCKDGVVDQANQLGKLHFKLRYNFDKCALVVSIVKCTDLPAKDPALTSSDPYVKLQLLPEKQHKVKTRVLRKTTNPVYDEDFTFYGINYSQLQNITLHFVVLSFDRYSRDDIIGEVVSPLAQLDLANTEASLSLVREINPRSLKIRSQGRGELLVSLCHQPAANRLTVVVLKARNLPKMDITGLSDPYVKIYLLFNGQRVAKKKTHVKKRTLNPVFNESFVFDLPPGVEGLDSISLEFLLLDWDRVTKNEVIGRLELGGSRAAGNGGSAHHHWSEVVTSPRRQIAEWHKLRE